MNTLSIILIIESLALLLVIALLLFLNWKNKKQRTEGIEQLLENVSEQEAERKLLLQQYLQQSYAMGVEEANESADYMVEAEKQFLQEFLKQQLEQQPLTDFYGNLCELLDQYLYFIPTIDAEQDKASEMKTIPDVLEDEDEPDWGDAFTESGDAMDEATKAGFDDEIKD